MGVKKGSGDENQSGPNARLKNFLLKRDNSIVVIRRSTESGGKKGERR